MIEPGSKVKGCSGDDDGSRSLQWLLARLKDVGTVVDGCGTGC